jgi:hypothetical protein
MANPNPSPETRFKPGQSGNPGGKTEGQRAAEIDAARISAEMRLSILSSLQEKLTSGEIKVEDLLDAATLKLFKDSEDRAHGTPKQAVDHTSSDGSMSPKTIDASKLSDEVLKALIEVADGHADD